MKVGMLSKLFHQKFSSDQVNPSKIHKKKKKSKIRPLFKITSSDILKWDSVLKFWTFALPVVGSPLNEISLTGVMS